MGALVTIIVEHNGIITKLPSSDDLYGNITKFGVVEESPEHAQVIHRHPKQSDIAIQISR